MMRTLHRFGRDGRYVESIEVDFIDGYPLDYWKLPDDQTVVALPKYDKAKEVPVWGGKDWIITPLSAFEPPAPTLEEVKARKIDELDTLWVMKMQEGLETSTGIKVKCEALDMSMLQIALEEAKVTGVCELFRDYEGVLHRNLSYSTIATIFNEVLMHLKTLWKEKVLEQEKAFVATSKEELLQGTTNETKEAR